MILQNVENRKEKLIMKKITNDEISMLQYRIQRFQAMGNGVMCQTLKGKLNKLLSEQTSL